MAVNNNTDFKLKQDSYVAFDALTLKELIQSRLTEGGVYTDQSFEGSNMSSIIDVISYSYHLLLFYLNQTSSETMFTDTSIYENMNRIVKLIDYKPQGYQTSLVSFNANASSNLSIGTYTVPRYSYLDVNGVPYSFISDATFNKTLSSTEFLSDFSESNLLREGIYNEYPPTAAIGEDFEVVTLNLKDPITNEALNIDANSVDVYVRDVNTSIISKYELTNNIFLESPGTKKFEKRLNENGLYELKFGNGVFSSKLNSGDVVLIYYIKRSGTEGLVSAGSLDGQKLKLFNTPQFNIVKLFEYNSNFNLINSNNSQFIDFSNTIDSTPPIERENVDSIRDNAAKNFQLQNRLVTSQDFENFISSNYSSILKSFKAVDNTEYVKNYLQYFYDIGLNRPNLDSRLLYNQVNFSTINQSNNVYLFLVSKLANVNEDNKLSFVNKSQKSIIVNSMQDKKLFNMNIVPMDPVYIAFTIGVAGNENPSKDIANDSFLVIQRDVLSNVSDENLKGQVENIFKNYFNSLELGSVVSIDELSSRILSINGVKGIKTRRTINGVINEIPSISLLKYNPIYPENDITVINENRQLPFFQYPYLQDQSIKNNILVENV